MVLRDDMLMMKNGQMIILRNGEMIVLSEDMILVDGTRIARDGRVIMVDGTYQVLVEGQAIMVENQGKTACYISDLMPTSAHIDLTWGMSFDLYPLDTIESKKRYYAKAIPEKWLTVFTHDPKTPWAYIEKDALGKMVAKGV